GCSGSPPRASSTTGTRSTAPTTGNPSGSIPPPLRPWCLCCSRGRTATRRSLMPTKPAATEFRPRPMRLSILTAALQELTPRERRDADPDLAIEEWLEFARQIGAPNIELSAALDPTERDVAAAGLLDRVAT